MSDIETYDESTTVSAVRGAINELNAGTANVYSSIKGDDFNAKMATLKAVTNSVAVADHLDKPINLQHVVVQVVEVTNEQTGEQVEVPRVILIDVDGTAYHAVSNGVFKAVENLIGVLGEPERWPEPVAVKVIRGKAKIGSYFTIELV